MTSKGQIVIPQLVRESLNINVGNKFAVIGIGDTIILKKMDIPSADELKALLKQTRTEAKKKKLKKSDVKNAIKAARK